MRLSVRAELDAVEESGTLPARSARSASRPHHAVESECSLEDVEADRCRAKAVSIPLWCYSPSIAPWGPRHSEYVTFALFFS